MRIYSDFFIYYGFEHLMHLMHLEHFEHFEHQLMIDSCSSPSGNLLSLSYSMPVFRANLFGLFFFKSDSTSYLLKYHNKKRRKVVYGRRKRDLIEIHNSWGILRFWGPNGMAKCAIHFRGYGYGLAFFYVKLGNL